MARTKEFDICLRTDVSEGDARPVHPRTSGGFPVRSAEGTDLEDRGGKRAHITKSKTDSNPKNDRFPVPGCTSLLPLGTKEHSAQTACDIPPLKATC